MLLSLIHNPSLKKYLFIGYWTLFYGFVLFLLQRKIACLTFPDDQKDFLLYSFLSLTIIYALIKNRHSSVSLYYVDIFFILYIAYVIVNSLWSATPFMEGGIYGAGLVLWGIAIRAIALSDLHKIIIHGKIVVFIGTLALALPLLESNRVEAIYLPIGHVSYYSNVAFLLLFLALFLFFYVQSKITQAGLFVASALIITTLLLSATRSSIVGFFIGLFVLIICLKKQHSISNYLQKNKQSLLLKTLSLLIAISTIYCFAGGSFRRDGALHQRLLKTAQAPLSDSGSSGRITIYKNTLEGFMNKPLIGWGYGSFKYNYPRFVSDKDPIEVRSVLNKNAEWVMHPHNELFNQLFEGGIIGTLLFLLIVLSLFYALLKIALSRNHKGSSLAALVLAAFVAIFVSFQFDSTSTYPAVRLVLLPYGALAYHLLKKNVSAIRCLKISKPIFLIFTCTVLLSSYAAIGQTISSHRLQMAKREALIKGVTNKHKLAAYLTPNTFETLYFSAIVESQLRHFQEAERHFHKTIDYFPYVPQAPLGLAHILIEQDKIAEATEVLSSAKQQFPFFEPFQALYRKAILKE